MVFPELVGITHSSVSLKTKPYKYNRTFYGAGRGIKKRSVMGKRALGMRWVLRLFGIKK